MDVIANTVQAAARAGQSAKTDQKIRLIFCLLAAVIVATLLALMAASLLQDPDNWWQVKVGLDILANQTIPTVDTYSHTFAGQPWIAKEWLGQVFLALAYSAGGWNGVVVLTVATISLTAFLLAWVLSASLKPILAVALTLAVMILICPGFTARPHIFTFPIIIAWTAYLFRAAGEERGPPFGLLLLLCLWANLHASFTLGFVIAGFAGLDFLARTRLSKPRLLAQWIAFGLLCPLVSLLNPYGIKAILATLNVAYGNEAVPLISEWRPFNASTDYLQAAALLLGVFGLLVSGVRVGWANALFAIFALYLCLIHSRFAYVFFLLVPIVLAVSAAQQYPVLSFQRWTEAKRDRLEQFFGDRFWQICSGGAIALICATALLISTYQLAPSQKTSAQGALAFARDNHLSGNVLNSYGFGGTLIFHGIRTFIDGRTDQLFLDGFTAAADELGLNGGGASALLEQIEKYAIDWALLSPGDNRIALFDELLGWHRAYSDAYAVIYVRAG